MTSWKLAASKSTTESETESLGKTYRRKRHQISRVKKHFTVTYNTRVLFWHHRFSALTIFSQRSFGLNSFQQLVGNQNWQDTQSKVGQQFQQKSSHFSAVTSGPRKSTKVGVPWRAQHLGMNWWEINILGHYPELQDNLQGNHSFQYWSLAKLLDWQKRRDQRCSKTQIATFWPQMVPGGQCPSIFRVETLAQSDPSCLVFFKEFALGPSFRYAPNHKRRIILTYIHFLSLWPGSWQRVASKSTRSTYPALQLIADIANFALNYRRKSGCPQTSAARPSVDHEHCLEEHPATSRFKPIFVIRIPVGLKLSFSNDAFDTIGTFFGAWNNCGENMLMGSMHGATSPPNSPPSILKDPGRLACRSPESERWPKLKT